MTVVKFQGKQGKNYTGLGWKAIRNIRGFPQNTQTLKIKKAENTSNFQTGIVQFFLHLSYNATLLSVV